jgi:hypothetical protein
MDCATPSMSAVANDNRARPRSKPSVGTAHSQTGMAAKINRQLAQLASLMDDIAALNFPEAARCAQQVRAVDTASLLCLPPEIVSRFLSQFAKAVTALAKRLPADMAQPQT